MLIYGSKSNKPQIQIDHPRYSKLANNTVTLDNMFETYFKKSVLGGSIWENLYSIKSETIKNSFNMCRTLKETPYVMEIILQRNTYGFESEAKKRIKLKLQFCQIISIQYHNKIRRYHMHLCNWSCMRFLRLILVTIKVTYYILTHKYDDIVTMIKLPK